MEEPDLPVGTLLANRYRVVKKLGQGGMGAVYEVKHKNTDRRLAVKVMLASNDPTASDRFIREARTACAVTHPAIVPVHDIVRAGGRVLMVMDLLKGRTLMRLLETRRPPEPPGLHLQEVAAYLLPIVSAVGALHAAGLVHRDLKPENIFVTEGKSFLLDFGIAKDVRLSARATQAFMGTPLYMAPEQATDKLGPIDHRTDIWSLGIVLYECFTGRAPTEGSGKMLDIYDAIRAANFPSVKSLAPNVPDDLAALIDSMLSADRERRPHSLERVYDVLANHANSFLLASYPKPAAPGSAPREDVSEVAHATGPRLPRALGEGSEPRSELEKSEFAKASRGQTSSGAMTTTSSGANKIPKNSRGLFTKSAAAVVVVVALFAAGLYWRSRQTAAPVASTASGAATGPATEPISQAPPVGSAITVEPAAQGATSQPVASSASSSATSVSARPASPTQRATGTAVGARPTVAKTTEPPPTASTATVTASAPPKSSGLKMPFPTKKDEPKP